MHTLHRRNVHQALPAGLRFLVDHGYTTDSRNGPVLLSPVPVATTYREPNERVVFYAERDGNPFFHLYEMLWMVNGRNDVDGPARYASNMRNYSDDGKTFHGAYGKRWRDWFLTNDNVKIEYENEIDQLALIAKRLKADPTDRRCVLQMWDVESDLDKNGKDVPCNTIATFQRGGDGALNLVVFCRSNDILWGAYGANAVHFSFLLEYMANWIGCPVGYYTQVSVNYHAYIESDVYKKTLPIIEDLTNEFESPYSMNLVKPTLLGDQSHESVDEFIHARLADADRGEFAKDPTIYKGWNGVMNRMLYAHHVYKTTKGSDRYQKAMDLLRIDTSGSDWELAGWQWLERRQRRYRERIS